METRIKINDIETNFWIDTTGRVRNEKTRTVLKGNINKGYHFYNLYFRGTGYTLYTHKLVATYFLDNPNNYPIVHHKDGNKLNNVASNLEWVSAEEHNKNINYNTMEKRSNQPININGLNVKQFRNSPYYATTQGDIINLDKNIKLNLEVSGNYLRFQGNYNLNKKHFLVHRVVWECFNGEIPEGYEINHIDGNGNNNALNNLELTTHSENCQKAKHNQIPIIAKNNDGIKEFSSINQAIIFLFGARRGSAPLKNAIKTGNFYCGYQWFYKE